MHPIDPAPRRLVIALLTLAIAIAGLVATGATPADARAGSTISGTLSTPGGAALTAPVQVILYSWFPPDDASFPTQQASVVISPGDPMTFSLSVQSPGHYAIRARPFLNQEAYLSTWYGSGETIATQVDQPGVVFVDENLTPQTGKDIVLRQGVTLTGTVRGTNGQPLADATVDAARWNADDEVEPIPGVPGGITNDAGLYRIAVPADTPASLSVTRRVGYQPWVLGGQTSTRTDDNTLVVTAGVTQDIELTPDWSGLGASGRVVRDESCAQQVGTGTADLGGLQLDVRTSGVITVDDGEWTSSPLAADSPAPALVPYWSLVARSVTWGVDGSTLCAIWRGTSDEMAYQAIVTRDGEVTFNYGTIGPNIWTAVPEAGWTEGAGDGRERVVLPGPYLDSNATTGLVHGSRNADLPGRYRFTFTGFEDTGPDAASITVAPVITPADPTAGDTLSVDDGTWTVPGGSTDDLAFAVQWLRDGVPIPGAIQHTLVTATDAPGRYTARITAHRPDRPTVSVRTSVGLVGAAPTAPRPDITGAASPGRTVQVATVAWSDGAATTGYQWRHDGVAITGATEPTYVVRERDVGHRLTAEVTAALDGHRTGRVLTTVRRVPKVPTRTVLDLPDGPVTTAVRPTVDLVVRGTGAFPTGTVQVREAGHVLATGTLTRADHGRLALTLPRLAARGHQLRAAFLGGPTARASISALATLTVTRP